MKENFLILGSQGFIGINLIHQLLKKKIPIISIGKKKNYIKDNKIKHIKTDVYKFKNYIKFLNENSIVIFLAASKFDFNLIKKFRVLIQLFKSKKIKKLLFVSSASVYGNNQNITSEIAFKRPINKQGKFFLKLENEIISLLKSSKSNFTILRTFNVFGKNRTHKGMIENFIQRLLKNNKVFYASSLNNFRTYISVNDLIKIIYKLSKKNKKNLIINVCNPHYIYSLKDISQRVYEITKKQFVKIITKNDKNIISNSICIPKKLVNMKLLKFKNNFNLELKNIINEYSV